MVMLILIRSCWLSEVGVGFCEGVGLDAEAAPVEDALVGGRPVPVSVSLQPANARPTTADSAVASMVCDLAIQGLALSVRVDVRG
jgi:hypothetical protein